MARGRAVLDPIDLGLGMFHPQSNGEGFHLQGHARMVKHPVAIPCAVTGRQKQNRRQHLFAILKDHAAKIPAGDAKARHAGLKPKCDAQAFKVLTHGGYHPAKAIGADMGFL